MIYRTAQDVMEYSNEAYSDEDAFSVGQAPEVTDQDRVRLYAIYREMGGEPFEPHESMLMAHLEGRAGETVDG